jgi:hypothetical protein
MKNPHLPFYFLWVIFALISCNRLENETIQTITPLKATTFTDDFSLFVDTLIFIPVQSNSGDFISVVSKILIDNNDNFLLKDEILGVQVIDKTGQYLRSIGTKGRGPGEYTDITDMCITSDGKYVWLLQSGGVSKYKIGDGKFVLKINLEQVNYDAICASDNGGFYLFSSNPPDESNFEEHFYALNQFDSNGEKIKEFLPRKDYVFTQGIFTQSYDKSTIMRPQEGDNIAYKIGKEIIPFLKIDFQNHTIPPKYIFKDGGDLFEGMKNYLFSDYYKLPIHIHDTKEHIYFSCIGPSALQNDFVLSKNTTKGFRWAYERSDRDLLFIMASDSNYFYTVVYYDRNDIKDTTSKNTTLSEFILTKLTQMQDSTNGVFIVKLRFKTNVVS